MKRLWLLLIVVVLFTGCAKGGLHVKDAFVPADEDFKIIFLFEVEGVKIYRFSDTGHWRYFSVGNGEYLQQVRSQTTGKTTTHYTN